MRLLGEIKTVERLLANMALGERGEGTVYGGGAFAPGEAFAELIAEHRAGTFRGTSGLVITEDVVNGYPGPLRQALGVVLQLGGVPSVADAQSDEWALHLGFRARAATYLGWAIGLKQAELILTDEPRGGRPRAFPLWWAAPWAPGWAFVGLRAAYSQPWGLSPTSPQPLTELRGIVTTDQADVGVAICAAVLGIPCVLAASHPNGKTDARAFAAPVRWARQAGVENHVAWTLEELQGLVKLGVRPVAPARVQEQREVALAEIERLAASADPIVQALGNCGLEARSNPTAELPQVGRTLEVGSIWTPETHYREGYYGGEAGIRYQQPDGSWAIYHGTGHDWQGFRPIADALARLHKGKLLDIGCGSGPFVRAALAAGFDAYGVDISANAIDLHPDLRGRVFVEDLCATGQPSLFATDESWDVITALDVLEHIPLSKIPTLLDRVCRALRFGGRALFNICTRGEGEQNWTIEPPCEVTRENSWLLVAGHVTIRDWHWWACVASSHGFAVDYHAMSVFNVAKASDPGLAPVASWSPRNVLIVERIR